MKQLTTIHSLITFVALLLAGCGSDEYLGSAADAADVERGLTISFNSATGKAARTAMLEGSDAAEKLNNKFVVFGTKTTDGITQTVFDHYTVNYTPGSAMTTATNSDGWEYVGNTVNNISTLPATPQQSIKYWDFSAERYDFIAFSTGTATQQSPTGTPGQASYPGTPATGKVIVTPIDHDNLTTKAYTLTGATEDLTKIYIAERITATKSAERREGTSYPYRDAMKFSFRPLASTVRLGLYETIPGYSVRDVRFYPQPISASTSTTPTLFATFQTIPSGKGIINIAFPDNDPASDNYNRATATYTPEGEKTQSLTLGSLDTSATPEQSELGGNIYIGRTASTASLSDDITIVPASVNDLTLKIDFTLVSIDYNETIEVSGATAVIPAAYTHWQPNHAYTYLFKITDKVANADGQVLYPVRFDALETVDTNGIQQTITTIDQPSITTYAMGELGNDYFVGDHIYVAVNNGTHKMLTSTNAKLYIAQAASNDIVTEKNIEDGLDGIDLVPVPAGFMTFVDYIDATDSPSGERIAANPGSNFAKFTAGNNIYVFEFNEDDELHYKVIRVGDARRPLVLPDIPEEDI